MSDRNVNEREIVLDILLEVEKGTYLKTILGQVLEKYAYLPANEKAFIKILSAGCLERQITLDYIIGLKSKVKPEKMKPVVRALLRMAVYQLKFMDGVPASAAINEAVKIAKKRKFVNLAPFINGVLRNIDRLGEISLGDIEDKSIRYSCPKWLVASVEKWYGSEKADAILRSTIEKPEMMLRVNTDMNTREELSAILAEEGIQTEASKVLGDMLIVQGSAVVGSSKAFAEGRYTVQDLSSVIAGYVAAGAVAGSDAFSGEKEEGTSRSGEVGKIKVLDMCAAPGGKAILAAQLLGNRAEITACDLTDVKVELIKNALERMKVENVRAVAHDALCFDEEYKNTFDLVIADLPCSGLGVIARKGDIKYRMTEADLESLEGLQRDILKNAAAYVKPGGVLMYSTCTINPGENAKQVDYLQEELGLKMRPFSSLLPDIFAKRADAAGYLQLLPGIDPCDGFFISVFEKRKDCK